MRPMSNSPVRACPALHQLIDSAESATICRTFICKSASYPLPKKLSFNDEIFVCDPGMMLMRMSWILVLPLYTNLPHSVRSEYLTSESVVSKSLLFLRTVDPNTRAADEHTLRRLTFTTCITTFASRAKSKDAAEIFNITEQAILSFFSAQSDGPLVIVDDGSDAEFGKSLSVMIENKTSAFLLHIGSNVGIARAKNACIFACLIAKNNYCILADNDVVFLKENWQYAYGVTMKETRQHVLAFGGTDNQGFVGGYNRGQAKSFSQLKESLWPYGAMLVISYRALEVLGAFKVFPGRWGHEHIDFHLRAVLAGLTDRYFDIKNSSDYLNLNTQLSMFSHSEKKHMSRVNQAALQESYSTGLKLIRAGIII